MTARDGKKKEVEKAADSDEDDIELPRSQS